LLILTEWWSVHGSEKSLMTSAAEWRTRVLRSLRRVRSPARRVDQEGSNKSHGGRGQKLDPNHSYLGYSLGQAISWSLANNAASFATDKMTDFVQG
jgi:hypothetical protein